MPRYNVNCNDKWACFSSIVDDFITPFMSLKEYENWREEEYGKRITPLERANKMTIFEALKSLSINKSDEKIMRSMREADLFYDKESEVE